MDNTQEYMDEVVEDIKEKLIEEDYEPIVISGNRILVGLEI